MRIEKGNVSACRFPEALSGCSHGLTVATTAGTARVMYR